MSKNDGDGAAGVESPMNDPPELYVNRLASCSGEMAGILYFVRMSSAFCCSSSKKSLSPMPGGPVGNVNEFDVAAVVGVVGTGTRERNRVESVCLYGGGGTKFTVYSSLSNWN